MVDFFCFVKISGWMLLDIHYLKKQIKEGLTKLHGRVGKIANICFIILLTIFQSNESTNMTPKSGVRTNTFLWGSEGGSSTCILHGTSLSHMYIPSLKLTCSPLKMDGWKTVFLLGRSIFRGYVSFREGKCKFISNARLSVAKTCLITNLLGHCKGGISDKMRLNKQDA